MPLVPADLSLLKHGFSASCHEKIANSEARTTGCETKSQESERTCTQENLACVSEFQVDASPAPSTAKTLGPPLLALTYILHKSHSGPVT